MVSPKKRATANSFPEALPHDVLISFDFHKFVEFLLINVLCGVEHDDLRNLFHVSKPTKEAAIIAKKMHFDYITPKKISAFRCNVDQSSLELVEIKAPNAPKNRE